MTVIDLTSTYSLDLPAVPCGVEDRGGILIPKPTLALFTLETELGHR